MALTVTHAFVSAKPDGVDPTIVQPSNWNDDHIIVGSIPIVSGGTGAATAADARTNLGLVIGTNVQAYDADLATWAGVTPGTGVTTFISTPTSANLAATVTDETGTGSLVFANTPTLVTPILGTPTSGTLTNCTGLPAAGVAGTALVAAAIGTTVQAYDADLTTWAGVTPGTGIATALAVNIGTAGSPVINGGVLGTPSSGTLTNCTGLPIIGGGTGAATAADARTNLGLVIGTNVQAYDADLTTWAGVTPGTGVAAFISTPSSANLATAITDETGTGALVFANTPTLVTPILGTPTSGTLTNCTGLPIGGGGTGQSTATAAFDALAPTTTQGDLIYHNGTDNVRLAKGTAGQSLVMNGTATAPEWATSGASVTEAYVQSMAIALG